MKKEYEALITKLLIEIEKSPKGELERSLRTRLWAMITEKKEHHRTKTDTDKAAYCLRATRHWILDEKVWR